MPDTGPNRDTDMTRFTPPLLAIIALLLSHQATAQPALPDLQHRGAFTSSIGSQGFARYMSLHDRRLYLSSSEEVIEIFEQSGPDWLAHDFVLSPTPIFSVASSVLAVNDRWLVVANSGLQSSTPGIITDVSQLNAVAGSFGGVMVFERVNEAWTFSAVIKAPQPVEGQEFGRDVSLQGNTLVIGSPGDSGSTASVTGEPEGPDLARSGAVYVIVHEAGSWVFRDVLRAAFADPQDRFGQQVLLDGPSLIVTAPAESGGSSGIDGLQSDNSLEESGAAYEFRQIDGLWTQVHYIKASNPDRFDRFGDTFFGNMKSLSKHGDLLVIGNSREQSASRAINAGEDDNSLFQAGAVYVFREQENSWVQEAYLKPNNTDSNDQFGSSVHVDDGAIVVGAFSEAGPGFGLDADPFENRFIGIGAAYRFELINDQWQQSAYIKTAEPLMDLDLPQLGSHVLTDANQLIMISAPGLDRVYPLDRPVSLTGQVTGMIPGTGLGLAFNTNSSFEVTENGLFLAPYSLPVGGQFDLAIASQPFDRVCELAAFDPNVTVAGVSDINIQCLPQRYTISGSVDGLAGNTMVRLQNNGSDLLEITSDGDFTFAQQLISGDPYDITVNQQPAFQHCTVNHGMGLVDAGDVDQIEVVCGVATVNLGGTLSGLAEGNFIELTSEPGNTVTLEVNGPFVFPFRLAEGSTYEVTISMPPMNFGQTCTVFNGSGTVIDVDILDVEVVCELPDALFADGFED